MGLAGFYKGMKAHFAWVLSATLTLLHLLYTLTFPSILNGEQFIWRTTRWIEPSYIQAFFHSRIRFGEFARRPLTSRPIQWINEYLNIPLEWAFVLVVYGLFFFALLALFRLSKALTQSAKMAALSVIGFTLMFWVLNAFFAGQYAFDEPGQYVFIFSMLLALHRERWWQFSLFLFMALVARESTLLLLPGIGLFFIKEGALFSRQTLIRAAKALWTLPLYGLFLFWLIGWLNIEEKSSSYMRDVRFKHLYYSFAELDIAVDTLVSLFLALGPISLLVYLSYSTGALRGSGRWVKAFLLNAGINTIITFVFTMGRETRIFAQPALMLVPWLGLYFHQINNHVKRHYSYAMSSRRNLELLGSALVLFAAVVFAISLLAYEVYWPTDTKFFSGFQHYFFIVAGLSFGLLLVGKLGEVLEQTGETRTKLRWAPLLFLIPVVLLFGNQKGYRAIDLYGPVVEALETEYEPSQQPMLVVATKTANVSDNYFSAQNMECVAGDFNYQLPLKQLLYNKQRLIQHPFVFIEMAPASNFPVRYILSEMGEAERTNLAGYDALKVDPNRTPHIEPHSFAYDASRSAFAPISTAAQFDLSAIDIREEYGPAFKVNPFELGITNLRNIVGRVDFQMESSAEAALVITVDNVDESVAWIHEFLNVYLVDDNGWNSAYIGCELDLPATPETRISFYVWNNKGDAVTVRDQRVVLNSGWLAPEVRLKYEHSQRVPR